METYINMYKCQNKCIKCIKNQEPRHLFIKKLYFGFFQTFKAYIYIYIGSPNKIFILSPAGFFISPVRNLLLDLTPENFLKFEIFPGESSRPHRGTETGCLGLCPLSGILRTLAYSNISLFGHIQAYSIIIVIIALTFFSSPTYFSMRIKNTCLFYYNDVKFIVRPRLFKRLPM